MNITLTILLTLLGGVVSGLVTTAIVVGLRLFWLKVINPWVEEKLYQDAEVKGTWTGTFESFTGDDGNENGIREFYHERIIMLQEQNQRLLQKKRRKRLKETAPGPPKLPEKTDLLSAHNGGEASATTPESKTDLETKPSATASEQSDSEDDEEENPTDEEATSESQASEMMIELQRVGHTITGRMVCVNGADQGRSYDLIGNFRNLLLTGTYQSYNKANLDRGGFCLMLRHNGDVLDGFFACYSDGEHAVSPFQCILKRKANES